MYVRYLGNHYHGRGNWGNWSATPYFHKGDPSNGAKVVSERRNVRKKLYFQTAISLELSDGDTKRGS